MSSVALTSSERACLQQVRHYVAEGIGNRSGWARAGTPLSGRWTWDDIHALVGRGLLGYAHDDVRQLHLDVARLHGRRVGEVGVDLAFGDGQARIDFALAQP